MLQGAEVGVHIGQTIGFSQMVLQASNAGYSMERTKYMP